jgi:creatinine amidohydrolase
MIDSNATTVDWQLFTGDVILLPIGSIEQHSAHLPVGTDWIEADTFARPIADALDAALLPTLPYSNCLEHSGFRGTFGLTPETLMHVVRDLAEEAERQNFKILIVLNGHGGNFSLTPACRDWNRRDRPLKILLVDFWVRCDPNVVDTQAHPRPEIHVGEWETSLMMALRPDLVRKPGPGMPVDPREPYPLSRTDLTTFGVGHFNPAGDLGFPKKASPETGRAIVDSILTNLIPWLNDRIARLRKNPRYSGAGGIQVRPVVPSDLPEIMRLKNIAGWNQTEADLSFFFKQFSETYWVAVHNGKVIGSTLAAVYDQKVAWIGMVLVDPEFRRQGVGRSLMSTALEALRHFPSVKLDATPDGKALYDRLGFKDEYLLHRMVTRALPVVEVPPSSAVRPMVPGDLPGVIAADRAAFGTDRSALLTRLFQEAPHLAWIGVDQPSAFCLGRRGFHFTQVGPVVAPSAAFAESLIGSALGSLSGQAVVLDVPESQTRTLDLLKTRGFITQRTLLRMYRETNSIVGRPDQLFAIAGPELG